MRSGVSELVSQEIDGVHPGRYGATNAPAVYRRRDYDEIVHQALAPLAAALKSAIVRRSSSVVTCSLNSGGYWSSVIIEHSLSSTSFSSRNCTLPARRDASSEQPDRIT